MSSLTRRIEKNALKQMGVHRNVSGYIVDRDGRVVGSSGGTKWPRFKDIAGLEMGGAENASVET